MLGRGFSELEFSFSPWIPHFSPDSAEASRALSHPVWIQMVELNRYLRQKEYLKELASKIGEVILIKESNSSKGKTAGPRIRTLVQDPSSLPSTITPIGSDRATKQEIKVLYSGLQNQCNRCRGFGHYAKDCKQYKNQSQARPQNNHNILARNAAAEQGQTLQPSQQNSAKDPRAGDKLITQGVNKGTRKSKANRRTIRIQCYGRGSRNRRNKQPSLPITGKATKNQGNKSGDQETRKKQTHQDIWKRPSPRKR